MSGCGECSLCCKVMAVEELGKPRNEWCPHCITRRACDIYDHRPEVCAGYRCLWLAGQEEGGDEAWGPEMRPDRCHVVLDMGTSMKVLVAHVDPGYPHAEHKQPVVGKLRNWLRIAGHRVIIATGEKRRLIATKR